MSCSSSFRRMMSMALPHIRSATALVFCRVLVLKFGNIAVPNRAGQKTVSLSVGGKLPAGNGPQWPAGRIDFSPYFCLPRPFPSWSPDFGKGTSRHHSFSGDSGSTRMPVCPSTTASGMPPAFDPIDGTPQAAASRNTIPKPSCC